MTSVPHFSTATHRDFPPAYTDCACSGMRTAQGRLQATPDADIVEPVERPGIDRGFPNRKGRSLAYGRDVRYRGRNRQGSPRESQSRQLRDHVPDECAGVGRGTRHRHQDCPEIYLRLLGSVPGSTEISGQPDRRNRQVRAWSTGLNLFLRYVEALSPLLWDS